MARPRINPLRRKIPRKDDHGVSLLETAALVTVAGTVVIGVVVSPISDTFHDVTRDMVCKVEGPECEGESWVEYERPEAPEEYVFAFGGSWDGVVRGEGDARVAIEFALAQLGKPYVWGATGTDGYDCSSLMMYSWAEAGVQIPRTTWPQMGSLPSVSRAELKPGDLIFFHTMPEMEPPTHVGMYLGDGQMVHAGDPVNVAQVFGNPYWENKWVGAARVPQK